jgi:hypothetical protein
VAGAKTGFQNGGTFENNGMMQNLENNNIKSTIFNIQSTKSMSGQPKRSAGG